MVLATDVTAEKPAVAGGSRNKGALDAALRALAARFGNRLVTSLAVREQHGHTLTWIANQPPDAVVFPQNGEEVQLTKGERASIYFAVL